MYCAAERLDFARDAQHLTRLSQLAGIVNSHLGSKLKHLMSTMSENSDEFTVSHLWH